MKNAVVEVRMDAVLGCRGGRQKFCFRYHSRKKLLRDNEVEK